MRFIKRLPVEFYLLLLPSIIIIGALYLSGNVSIIAIDKNSAILGSPLGRAMTFLIMAVISLKIFLYMLGISYSKSSSEEKHRQISDLLLSLMSAIFLFITVIVATCAVALSALYLFKTSPIDKIVAASMAMMAIDLKLFGNYMPFAIQSLGNKSPLFEILITQSYGNLLTLIPIFGIISIFKKEVFRQFVLSFFIAVALSWPIWYLVPALQPGLMFKTNLLKVNIPTSIQKAVTDNPSTGYANSYIEKYNKFWIDPDSAQFSTSNMPSMHVAWGLLLVYYSVQFSVYLGILTVPWFILNTIGTMYVLQHYAIDAIGGIIIACLTIFITNKIFGII